MVGQKAHRVKRLLRGSGGHQHAQSLEVLRRERLLDAVQQRRRIRQLAAPRIAAGEVSRRRVDDVKSPRTQSVQILLRDRIVVHSGVHRRRDDNRRFGRQQRGRNHIIRNAVRRFGNNIRGCGCDNKHIRGFRQRDMLHLPRKVAVEGVHHRAISG